MTELLIQPNEMKPVFSNCVWCVRGIVGMPE